MDFSTSLIRRVSDEVGLDVNIKNEKAEASESLRLAIDDAVNFILGDLPDDSFWGFINWYQDEGQGVELPNDKDYAIPIGACFQTFDYTGLARRGDVREKQLYTYPKERYWYYDPLQRKCFVMPEGGQVAIFSFAKEDLNYATEDDPANPPDPRPPLPKGLWYSFMRLIVVYSAYLYIEKDLAKSVSAVSYDHSNYPELPDYPTLVNPPSLTAIAPFGNLASEPTLGSLENITFDIGDNAAKPSIPTLGSIPDIGTLASAPASISFAAAPSAPSIATEPSAPTLTDFSSLVANLTDPGNAPSGITLQSFPSKPTIANAPSGISLTSAPTKPTAPTITYNPQLKNIYSWTSQTIPDITLESPSAFSFTDNAPAAPNLASLGAFDAFPSKTEVPLPGTVNQTISDTDTLAEGSSPNIGGKSTQPLTDLTSWEQDIAKGTEKLSTYLNNEDSEMVQAELARLRLFLDRASHNQVVIQNALVSERNEIERRLAQLAEKGPLDARYRARTERYAAELASLSAKETSAASRYGLALQKYAQEIQKVLDVYRNKAEVDVAKHAQELEVWQNKLGKAIQDWTADFENKTTLNEQKIQSILGKLNAEVNAKQALVAAGIAENDQIIDIASTDVQQKIAIYQNEIQAFVSQVQAWATETGAKSSNYQSAIEAWATKARADADLFVAQINAIAQQEVVKIRDYEARLNGWSTEAQVGITQDQQKIDVAVQGDTLKLASYRELLEAWATKTTTNFNNYATAVQAWATSEGAKLAKYQADVDVYATKNEVELSVFQGNLQKYITDVDVKLQVYNNAVQLWVFDAQDLLNRYQLEAQTKIAGNQQKVETYIAELNAWATEIQVELQKYIEEAGILVTNWEASVQTWNGTEQNKLVKYQQEIDQYVANTEKFLQKFQNELQETDFKVKQNYFVLERKNRNYRDLRQNFIRQSRRFKPDIPNNAKSFYA